ncbi:radical SAM protein [Streptomyces sp. MA15]|uniref:radical SAM/SPASM domain-containing protein n=1 Tax=Streptomyces sp. MA15 TaxID=3055061 RepID=UPI0025B0C6BC|nr:radical SAM protein [Streptomyces sp. MA15]MDN3271496.1 radical SAM protein [Streptomyces sp. MA15]
MTMAPEVSAALRFLSLEITGRCQLSCPLHCYAQAGPTRGHGSMTGQDWHRVIDEAAVLGVTAVQFIGGEPTLHPDFTNLVEHAVRAGLRVRVYSNLFRVRDKHWQLFQDPRVSVATSYYSDDAGEHDAVTGRAGSHAATRANIVEAVRRRVRVQVGIVDLGGGRRVGRARAEMQALGVEQVRVDRVRAVGNAAGGAVPLVSSLCGRCGDGKAAVLPDGTVAVCEIGRFLTAGSVRGASLASVLAGERWAEVAASVPRRAGAAPCDPDCSPNDGTCQPSSGGTCGPSNG